jgi:hypothetical protein
VTLRPARGIGLQSRPVLAEAGASKASLMPRAALSATHLCPSCV